MNSKYLALYYGFVLFLGSGSLSAQMDWSSVHKTPTASTILDFCDSAEGVIAVGKRGTVLHSSEGLEWERAPRVTTSTLNRIIAHADTRYAVGTGGIYLESRDDGRSWQRGTVPSLHELRDIAVIGDTRVCVGRKQEPFPSFGLTQGIITASGDGLNWTETTSVGGSGLPSLDAVAASDELFVAVGSSIGGFSFPEPTVPKGYVYVSEDGRSWERSLATQTLPSINGVIRTDSVFLVFGESGLLLLSANGLQWEQVSGTGNDATDEVIWTGDRFIAVVNQTELRESVDGLSWSTVGELPFGVSSGSLHFSAGRYLVAGDSGSIFISADGFAWTNVQNIEFGESENLALRDIVTSPGGFLAVGHGGALLASPNGHEWSLRELGVDLSLTGICVGMNKFVTVAGGGRILVSGDGLEWTEATTPTTENLRRVTYGESHFIAVGAAGTILKSVDGLAWTLETSLTTINLNDVVWSVDRFVAVGNSGLILSSPDGSAWSIDSTGFAGGTNSFGNPTLRTPSLTAIAADGERLVVVGGNDCIAFSEGVGEWEVISYLDDGGIIFPSDPRLINFRDVQYAANRFVAVGSSGRIKISVDGLDWFPGFGDAGHQLVAVAHHGGSFVTFDENGGMYLAGETPLLERQTASQFVLRGSGTTLSAETIGSEAVSYQWYLGGIWDESSPLPDATENTLPLSTVTESHTYWLKVIGTHGTLRGNPIQVVPVDPPEFVAEPANVHVRSGNAAVLFVDVQGGGLRYQWFQGETGDETAPIEGAQASSYTTEPLSEDAHYWVRAWNAAGEIDSDTILAAAVTQGPVIISQSVSGKTVAGEPVTLFVQAEGRGLSYQWYRGYSHNSILQTGATEATFTFVPSLTEAIYFVRVTNPMRTVSSAYIRIVQVSAPSFQSLESEETAFPGVVPWAKIDVAGGGLSYQWYEGESGDTSRPILGATDKMLMPLPHQGDRNYWVRIWNVAGEIWSETVELFAVSMAEVLNSPELNFSFDGWTGQTSWSEDGGASARTAPLPDLGSALLQTIVEGPGRIEFSWKVSSEEYFDWLRFYIDGVEQPGPVSGEVDWQRQTYLIEGDGPHQLSWIYSKDDTSSDYLDMAWIDSVEWYPEGVERRSFRQWILNSGAIGAAAQSEGDPDGDGIVNYLEYGLGMDAFTYDTRRSDATERGLPMLEVEADSFTFSYVRPAGSDGSYYAVESNDRLSIPNGWQRVPGAYVSERLLDSGDTLVEIIRPMSESAFFRLKFEEPLP